jgi:hypothetical protein
LWQVVVVMMVVALMMMAAATTVVVMMVVVNDDHRRVDREAGRFLGDCASPLLTKRLVYAAPSHSVCIIRGY